MWQNLSSFPEILECQFTSKQAMPGSVRTSHAKEFYEPQEIADLYQSFDTYVPEEVFENYQRTLIRQKNLRVQIILPEDLPEELVMAMLASLSEVLGDGNVAIVQGVPRIDEGAEEDVA